MAHRRYAILTLFVLVASAPSCHHRARPVQPSVGLRTEVERLNRDMVAAFMQGDLAGVARFYADDARIIGPRRRTIAGRAAIDEFWTSIRGPREWRLTVVEVGGSRNEAYQVGVSSLTSEDNEGRVSTYVSDFVVLWKRDGNGRLRIHLDLYN